MDNDFSFRYNNNLVGELNSLVKSILEVVMYE